nr:glycosyltransferase family 39 protein [Oculatellaceae cyanobacterium Prado106]
MKHSSKLRLVIIGVLILGIAFRFLNLDRKIFWHDEVYTSMRAAGYTRGDVDQLFQNQMVAAPVLQQFQQIKPGSTIADTIRSLKTEDPQHPPLYFVMARLWMAVFGSAIAVTRVFPVLISLLSLPLMYKLAIELFASRWVAGWAMA